jgi:hypothetical protein
MINWEVSELDVAMQPSSSGNLGSKYDRVVLATASHEGVEFMWWLIIPRRYFVMKDGQRVMMPETDTSWMPGEPGRLDDLPGKARVSLSAYHWNDQLHTPQGTMGGVEQWVEVPIPADQGPNTIDNVAALARRDLQIMQYGGSSSLFGVAADTKDNPQSGKPLSGFEPDRITEAEYAAAVRRGVDDLRRFDEVHLPDPSNDLPPAGKGPAPPR